MHFGSATSIARCVLPVDARDLLCCSKLTCDATCESIPHAHTGHLWPYGRMAIVLNILNY